MDQELFTTLLHAMWDATADALIVVDQEGEIVLVNDRVSNLLGWDSDDLVGERIETLVPHGRRGEHRSHFRSYVEKPAPRRMGGDIVLFALTARGEEVPVDISLSSVRHDDELYTLATVRDASARFAYEEELRRLGFHDALTGLYNRHYFNEELLRAENGREWPVVILMADVDGLKQVNDAHGHEKGDELIQRAARAITESVRGGDVVARLGGDEFAVILRGVGTEDPSEFGERIQARCEAGKHSIPLRISTGFAQAHQGESLRAALRRADARMYEAKAERKRSN